VHTDNTQGAVSDPPTGTAPKSRLKGRSPPRVAPLQRNPLDANQGPSGGEVACPAPDSG